MVNKSRSKLNRTLVTLVMHPFPTEKWGRCSPPPLASYRTTPLIISIVVVVRVVVVVVVVV